MDRALRKTLDKHDRQLSEILKAAGIPSDLGAFEPLEFERKSIRDFPKAQDRFRLTAAALEQKTPHVFKDDVLRLAAIEDGDAHLFAKVQNELGRPGTSTTRRGRNKGGVQLTVEQNAALDSYSVRGSYGSPGLYEDMYRRDPGLHRHTNELGAMMCAATYEPGMEFWPDDELREVVRLADLAIKNVKCGFSTVKQNATTLIRNGFAPFEPIWAYDDARGWYLYNLPFREQSTVEEWIFDDRQSQLLGCGFRVTNGGQFDDYVLPYGDTPETARLLVANIGATGNNIEGVPAYRPASGYFKLKITILALIGAGLSKYLVPLALIVSDTANATIAELGSFNTENQGLVQTLINRLQALRARIAPVVQVPPGKKVEYMTPASQMPDMRPLLEYLDFMMAMAFHSEGALLGTQTGSYALAGAKESSFMRSAPQYALRMCSALDQLLKWHVQFNYSKADQLAEWPKYSFRFAGSQDQSKWTDDLVKGLPAVQQMPPVVRRMWAGGLGLPANAFDNAEPATPPAPIEEDA
jgi:hypothetical protein